MNAGNDVMSAFDIKKVYLKIISVDFKYLIFHILTGFEYAGGIKNLKDVVAEVSDTIPEFQLTPIPEFSSIRNIICNDTN